jgi:hypothetical protein
MVGLLVALHVPRYAPALTRRSLAEVTMQGATKVVLRFCMPWMAGKSGVV